MFSISKQDRNIEISKEYMKYLHNNLSKILLNDIVQTKLTIIEAKRNGFDGSLLSLANVQYCFVKMTFITYTIRGDNASF